NFLCVLALAVKPSPYRRLFFIPLLLMSPYMLSLDVGHVTANYMIGTVWFTYLFAASDWILLTDVQRELHMVKPLQRADEPIEKASLSRRISWGMKLWSSTRGIGWAHEPRHALPPRPSPSTPRSTFVLSQILWAVVLAVLLEAVNFFNMPNPALYPGGPSLAAYGWVWRYEAVWAWGMPMYLLGVVQHHFAATLSVATGSSDPEDWPPFCGSITHSWSVRNFWGRTWHQSMRRFLSAHGKFLAHKVLGVKPGSKASAYIQLYTAFLISGIMHYLPEYMALRHWGGRALVFFLLQAVAITFEECVQQLGRRMGITANWKWKVVGFSWVWSWFAFCLPMWQDPL
ncbi:membrane bound O-acyl transferase family-domain-containing protein, partial [Mycena sp. CBHHK59/15]